MLLYRAMGMPAGAKSIVSICTKQSKESALSIQWVTYGVVTNHVQAFTGNGAVVGHFLTEMELEASFKAIQLFHIKSHVVYSPNILYMYSS